MSAKFISVAFCILILMIEFQSSFVKGRGGRGGGGSRGGGSRGGGSRGGSKNRIPLIIVPITSPISLEHYKRQRQYSSSNPVSANEDAFIYYGPNDLDNSFDVNSNRNYTPFLYVRDKSSNDAFHCLVVPKNVEKSDCANVFEKHVNNQTVFKLPQEYDDQDQSATTAKINKDNIAVCCDAPNLIPSFWLFSIVICAIWLQHFL